MDLRDGILLALDRADGGFVAGEQLAAQLAVSRREIWRAIRALRADGTEIETRAGAGYRLAPGTDVLNAALIATRLEGVAAGWQIDVCPALGSTNKTLKERAAAGAAHGNVLIAARQSAGRGRMERSFFSPDGTGLYMSILVRRPIAARASLYLTTAAAVAVADGIRTLSGREPGIKWVNDVWLDGRKVCGILTEGAVVPGTDRLDFAVVGIGVNLAPPKEGFPPEIRDVAGAVFPDRALALGARVRLAAYILNRLAPWTECLPETPFLAAYRRCSFLPGRQITVERGEERRAAVAVEIDDAFRLVVRYPDGTTEALDSGEVSVRVP